MTLTVKIKATDPRYMPCKKHPEDAGFDLVAAADVTLPHKALVRIPVGFSMELPPGTEAQIRGRSSLNARGIWVPTGTVDSNYRGPIEVVVLNLKVQHFVIQKGDRIAQMIIQRLPEVQLVEATDLSETDRGTGGFGSTGRTIDDLNSGTDA